MGELFASWTHEPSGTTQQRHVRPGARRTTTVEERQPRTALRGFEETVSRPLRPRQEGRRRRSSHHRRLRGHFHLVNATNEDEKRALANLQSSSSIKDLGGVSYYCNAWEDPVLRGSHRKKHSYG